ncbi:unnamed protein product, partial [Meganyctiphanes norvegica]
RILKNATMKLPVEVRFQGVLLFLAAAIHVGYTAKLKLLAPEDASEGEDVSLVCEYAIQEKDIYSIKWYKGSREFFRVTPGEVPERQVFKVSGVKIDLEDGLSGSRKVTLKDSESRTTGRYRCELVLKPLSFNQTLKSKAVKIIVKPLQVLVGSLDSPQYLRRGVNGHLICACGEELKEDGASVLVWLFAERNGNQKEFARMTPAQQPQHRQPKEDIKYARKKGINVDVSQSNTERLVLKRVGRRTSGTYVCQVIKEESVMCAHTASIRVIDAPVMGPFSFPPSISVGRPVSAICSAAEGHRPFSISFKKDGVPLKREFVMTLDGFSSQLLIPVTTLEDSGVYTCSASNPVGRATTTAKLTVLRRLRIKSLVVPSVAKRGTDANLYCNFAPLMDAHTVTWIANSVPIFAFYLHNNTKEFLKETSLTVNVDKSDGTVLSLHNVQPQHSGDYTCKVEGSHAHLNGVQDKKKQHMSVTETGMEAEVQILSLDVPSHIVKGKDVELYCEFDLLKYSLYEVNWYHNGDTVFRHVPQNKEEPKVVYPKEGINVDREWSSANYLSLQDIGIAASGTYSCEATINGSPFTTASKSANMAVIESSFVMDIIVPKEVAEGEDTDMRCEFQDRSAATLSWFHDDKIFLKASLNGRRFKFLHVSPDMNIDEDASTARLVVLRNVSQSHSGIYRCEVTTSPDLKVAVRSATMAVRGSHVILGSQEGPQYLLQARLHCLAPVISLDGLKLL